MANTVEQSSRQGNRRLAALGLDRRSAPPCDPHYRRKATN